MIIITKWQPSYRIRGIIGESNIWRIAIKMQLARVLMSTA